MEGATKSYLCAAFNLNTNLTAGLAIFFPVMGPVGFEPETSPKLRSLTT